MAYQLHINIDTHESQMLCNELFYVGFMTAYTVFPKCVCETHDK